MTTIDPPRAIRVKTSTGWADLVIQGPPGTNGTNGTNGVGVPIPVVNGQWVKGVGGVAVWSPITAADVSGIAARTSSGINNANTDLAWAGGGATTLYDGANGNGAGTLRSYGAPPAGSGTRLLLRCNTGPFTVRHNVTGGSGVPLWTVDYQAAQGRVISPGEIVEFVYDATFPLWLEAGRAIAGLVTPDQAWITLPLVSPWSSYAGGSSVFGVGQYRKTAAGMVVLRGLLSNSAPAAGQTICTFPAGYRPGSQDLFGVINNGGISRLDVLTNGVLQLNTIFSGDNSSWMSVANVSWYASG